jgi:hypothetical protein
MRNLLLALTALSLVASPAASLAAKPCKDKHGRFIKCPKLCRDKQGHFIKCR